MKYKRSLTENIYKVKNDIRNINTS